MWSNPNSKSDVKGVNYNSLDITTYDAYNLNQLQNQNQKSFVEQKHQFSNCESNWKPPLYRYVVDSVRNSIELLQGTQLHKNSYISIYPNIPN